LLATDLTYLQLRQRIVGELNRDDLDTEPLTDASVVHQFVKDRVNHYSKEFFYNAQFVDTSKSTTIGSAWVDLPGGWQDVNFVRLLQGSIWLPIGSGTQVPYQEVLESDNLSPSQPGMPDMFALYQNPSTGNMAMRFYCVPDAVYQLELTMDKPPDAPVTDAEVSFWTTDAQTLISESVCEELCKRRINRPLKAEQHRVSKEEAEASMTSKSIRNRGGIQVKSW
jgi:hypothetical protein